ncbi:hypothetical protein [Paenibacillus sp. YYML68]|uniref:hypothetical protein n=1 Tax=Paenibacillus sp. YYML68 TaxID=2909250 RepID=UPI00249341B4|nr:hypothetical protein [Paenibacillus sp. YYML68]
MTITSAFRNAVASGDVLSIRIMMKDSLLVDPTFTEFNEMERYTQAVNGLYDEHDGRTLEDDPSAWNDDYMSRMMVQIIGNFSRKRIGHLQKIVRHLRPVDARQQTRVSIDSTAGNSSGHSTYRQPYSGSSQTIPNYHQQKWLDSRNNRIRTTRVTTGVVGGGLVVGTATAIAGGSIVAGAAVGAIVVGAVVYIATNRR